MPKICFIALASASLSLSSLLNRLISVVAQEKLQRKYSEPWDASSFIPRFALTLPELGWNSISVDNEARALTLTIGIEH